MKFFYLFTLLSIAIYGNSLESYSKKFLGAPYGFSPLGEEQGVDKDPRFRTDKFDCTTYVETVLAYSIDSKNPQSALDKIRYIGGKPHFYNRRHFPAIWLKTLIEEEILEDVTVDFHGYKTITKTINKEVWSQREPKFLQEFDEEKLPNMSYTLAFIPLKKLKNLKIQEPLVFSMVRENKKTKPIVITHQGLLINKENKTFVRHARGKPVSKVVEEPLEDFVQRIGAYKSWKVLGLNLAREK